MARPRTLVRPLVVPIEGAMAVRTCLGIMDDHMVEIDPHIRADLEQSLVDAFTEDEWEAMAADGERRVALSIEEADAVLRGLTFTDIASADLPFYELVAFTVSFVAEALVDLWTPEEWDRFRG